MRNILLLSPIKKSFSFLLLAVILSGALFPAEAQTRRILRRTSAAKALSSAKSCNGGWSGSIAYTKTFNNNFSDKKQNIVKGTTENTTIRNYEYSGRIQVKDWHEMVVGIAAQLDNKMPRGQVTFKDEDKSFRRAVGQDTCGSNSGMHDQWINSIDNSLTRGFAEGEMKMFNLNIFRFNGTYSFTFRFPDARGTLDRELTATSGGFCNPKNNGTKSSPRKMEVNIPGESAIVQNQRLDPKNPDVLTGSVTKDMSGAGGKGFILTTTWNLRRCPAPLELEAVAFDDKSGPEVETWKRIPDVTEDGNLVRIRARVTNYSNETKFPVLTFSEMQAGFVLNGGRVNASIAPGESREVTLVLDTKGMSLRFAQRTIKVEMDEPTSPHREMSVGLKVSMRGILPMTEVPPQKKP